MDVFLALRFGGNAIFRNLYYLLPTKHFAGATVESRLNLAGFGQFCQGFPAQEKSLPRVGTPACDFGVYSSRGSDQSKHVAFLTYIETDST
jgi:hypothetical protein